MGRATGTATTIRSEANMMCARPAHLRIVAALLLPVSAAPIAYSQQEDKITLCVPGENVDRDGFEQPVPGSNMAAFHAALRNFLLDHADSRLPIKSGRIRSRPSIPRTPI